MRCAPVPVGPRAVPRLDGSCVLPKNTRAAARVLVGLSGEDNPERVLDLGARLARAAPRKPGADWRAPFLLTGVLAVGENDEAMRTAVERVAEMGGGWAVVDEGEVVAELPTRVAGVCSDLEVEETAKLYDAVESALRRLGADVERPMLAVQTMTFPGVPRLKFTFSGYADILNREVVGLPP